MIPTSCREPASGSLPVSLYRIPIPRELRCGESVGQGDSRELVRDADDGETAPFETD